MNTTAGEIPKISNRRLKCLAQAFHPVLSVFVLPLGLWPQEDVRTYFLKVSRNVQALREINFLRGPLRKRAFLVEEDRIKTLHVPGSAGRTFHPTMAEVLAQIPKDFLDAKKPGRRVVAFETFQTKDDEE